MKIELESTHKIVTLVIDGVEVPARIWEGTTAAGVACHAYITRIAVHKDADASQFEAELQEAHMRPAPALEAIPLRYFVD